MSLLKRLFGNKERIYDIIHKTSISILGGGTVLLTGGIGVIVVNHLIYYKEDADKLDRERRAELEQLQKEGF